VAHTCCSRCARGHSTALSGHSSSAGIRAWQTTLIRPSAARCGLKTPHTSSYSPHGTGSMEWRRRRSAIRSVIVQQHLALLCATACTVHQSADTGRRSRLPQCDLTSDSSRELLPPRRETPTFWNWIAQALSQPEISRRRDGKNPAKCGLDHGRSRAAQIKDRPRKSKTLRLQCGREIWFRRDP
jgi:hypothetical protein